MLIDFEILAPFGQDNQMLVLSHLLSAANDEEKLQILQHPFIGIYTHTTIKPPQLNNSGFRNVSAIKMGQNPPLFPFTTHFPLSLRPLTFRLLPLARPASCKDGNCFADSKNPADYDLLRPPGPQYNSGETYC